MRYKNISREGKRNKMKNIWNPLLRQVGKLHGSKTLIRFFINYLCCNFCETEFI